VKSIRDVLGQTLHWQKPEALGRYWELMAGQEVIATLKFERMGGTLATATCADGQWTFKRSGFLHVRVHVRKAGSDQDVAIFFPRWNGSGTLEGPGGARTLWYSKGFFHAQWGWQTETGADVMTLTSSSSFLKHMADVVVAPEASGRSDLALLALVGFYLSVLMTEDAAAAAVVVVCG
jgi:hypothetical protein